MSAATRLHAVLMKHGEQACARLLEVLPEVFPWVRFLPADDVQAFLSELVEVLRAVEEFDNGAVAQLIAEWRHTAEVYGNPELLEILTRDGDDFGPVPAPSADD